MDFFMAMVAGHAARDRALEHAPKARRDFMPFRGVGA